MFQSEFVANVSNQGILIWAALDPANPFIHPAGAPFVIGLVYAAMIWGFADISISTNMARDLGTRMVAAIFYGREGKRANPVKSSWCINKYPVKKTSEC